MELGELFQKQADRFGARLEFETAEAVDLSQRPVPRAHLRQGIPRA